MNLRDRLRMMKAAGTEPRTEPHSDPAQVLATEAPAGAPDAPAQLAAALPGLAHLGTTAGPALILDTVYPPEYARGRAALDGLLSAAPGGWARLGRHPSWADRAVQHWVFLDTETTGLAGGTGTVIFLAGIGRFLPDGSFRIRQFFLPDLSDEEAFLAGVTAEFAGAAAVVSFNGKSFDWPLLLSRCILHRRALPPLPHLDALHPARRLWRHVTADCSLRGLEVAVLGEQRWTDVPGYLIPTLYFQYLRSGQALPLAAVFLHNRLDILSLAVLTGYLGQALSAPAAATPAGRTLSPGELLAMGRWLMQVGDGDQAVPALQQALTGDLPPAGRAECRRLLGTMHRRSAKHDLACQVWSDWVAEAGQGQPEPYVQLAKHYEHRERDYGLALQMTRLAIAAAEHRTPLAGWRSAGECSLAALRHRWQRLEAKLRRAPTCQPGTPVG